MAQCHNSINFEVWHQQKNFLKSPFFLTLLVLMLNMSTCFGWCQTCFHYLQLRAFKMRQPIQFNMRSLWLGFMNMTASKPAHYVKIFAKTFLGIPGFCIRVCPILFFTLLDNKCWWKHKMRERDDVGIIRFFAQWLVPNIYQKFLFQFVIRCPIKKKIAILISDSFTAALTAIWHDKRVSLPSGSIISNAYYQWLWIV